jgi:spore maturation protein CgeB
MGHEVVQFQDPDSAGSSREFPKRIFRKVMKRLPKRDRYNHVVKLNEEVERFGPEIVIVQKGLHLAFGDIMALRRYGCWVCNVNHDDFFSANPNNWSALQRRALPAYHFIFTTRSVNVAEVAALNRNVEFFPFAYYPRIHRLVEIEADEQVLWDTDVVFVGTYERPRAKALEELLRRGSFRLAIHGAQWSKLPSSSLLRSCVRSSDLRFDELCKAHRGARISLGFLRKENRDDYTQRTFEIPACGGVLLAERTAQHMEYFAEGIEAEFFDPSSFDELAGKVALLLANPQRREKMRQAGFAAVLKGKHTYKDRLQRLLWHYEQREES